MGNVSEFETASPGIIAAVKAGATVAEAAAGANVPERTVKRWLSEGRKSPTGTYGNFAFAVDFIREHRKLQDTPDGPVDEDEVLLHISAAIRSGSVQAMKLWVDSYRNKGDDDEGEKPADPLGDMDKLAAGRGGHLHAV